MASSESIELDYEISSGNVFEDLCLPDAKELLIKSGLTIELTKAIRRLQLTQQEAAVRMGISQAKVSGLMRGDFTRLSEQKLMECLTRLGYNVEITVSTSTQASGQRTLAVV